MALSQKQFGHITMFTVICFFAINIPISKYLLQSGYISAYGLTLARISFATVAFWIASVFIKKDKIERKDHLILFAGALLGIIFNQGLFIFGLSNTSPVDASIITTSSPLFAMIIAALVLKEPITTQKVSGVLLGGVGAIFLVYTGNHGDITTASSLKGNLSVVGSSLSYATYLVITKPLTSKYSSVTLMKWMFLYSLIMLMPLFYKDLAFAPLFQQSDFVPYILIGYTLLFATFIAYMLIPIAQQRIRATTISMYNNLQPLIASFIAIVLGQDHFSIEKAISAILIFSGVYLVTQSKSRADVLAEQQNKA
ncbi:DMT family transporter [Dysgonomonas macrotermitis]|uniref:EamA domain-containing membrane protein RarD n=1 Tax=Dysgonomonas macrotermitis TaxID=1346286 RepID=A0A1M4TP97_9BACT|nr:DMT family transporter [Dysgonomonas macrotermitis]SHE46263.1 EamA domain-containing membrane protein RarD [Dysgonomonas macrotermitis]